MLSPTPLFTSLRSTSGRFLDVFAGLTGLRRGLPGTVQKLLDEREAVLDVHESFGLLDPLDHIPEQRLHDLAHGFPPFPLGLRELIRHDPLIVLLQGLVIPEDRLQNEDAFRVPQGDLARVPAVHAKSDHGAGEAANQEAQLLDRGALRLLRAESALGRNLPHPSPEPREGVFQAGDEGDRRIVVVDQVLVEEEEIRAVDVRGPDDLVETLDHLLDVVGRDRTLEALALQHPVEDGQRGRLLELESHTDIGLCHVSVFRFRSYVSRTPNL